MSSRNSSSWSGVVSRCFLLCCLFLTATDAAASQNDYALTEVAIGIFVHQGLHEEMTQANDGDIVNTAFVIGSDGVLVIDPGGSVRIGRRLLAAIESRTIVPVKWVVLTHIHPDHVAAVSVFSESVEVIAHVNYPRALAQRGDFYLGRFPTLYDTDRSQALRLPDTLVKDRLVLDLGDRQLTIKAHPTAHTDNDLTVLDHLSNTLFASDLVFAQRLPSLDGSLPGWLSVLESLADKEYALVVPGHGKPGRWLDVVEPQLRYLRELRKTVAAQLEHGNTLSEAVDAGMRQANEAGWILFDSVHPVNITKAYTELEWE